MGHEHLVDVQPQISTPGASPTLDLFWVICGQFPLSYTVWSNVERALTGQRMDVAWARWMSVSLRYGSVFEAGSKSVMESFALNLTCFRARCDWDDEESQVSHVNSSDRRNSINVIQSAALRSRSFLSFGICGIIWARISDVSDSQR